MGDFVHTVGSGISGLVSNALGTIGDVLQGLVAQIDAILPGGSGVVILVGAVLLLLLGWNILRR